MHFILLLVGLVFGIFGHLGQILKETSTSSSRKWLNWAMHPHAEIPELPPLGVSSATRQTTKWKNWLPKESLPKMLSTFSQWLTAQFLAATSHHQKVRDHVVCLFSCCFPSGTGDKIRWLLMAPCGQSDDLAHNFYLWIEHCRFCEFLVTPYSH